MAAVPASLHNDAARCECGKPLTGPLAPHACDACGRVQPVSKAEDYFVALGEHRRFGVDLAAIQKRFYELSRALHPDRFGASDAEQRSRSVERMSLLNQAFMTLRSASTLREYLLELEGIEMPKGTGGPAQLPMELAEGWFELQDALTENPDQASIRLKQFEADLKSHRDLELKSIQDLEATYDSDGSREALQAIARKSQTLNYLASMHRDVERLKQRLGAR